MTAHTAMTDEAARVKEWYTSRFRQLERALNGESRTPLHVLRRDALARFSALGFPTTENEEWRFTNVAPIARAEFAPVLRYERDGVSDADIERIARGTGDAIRMVFVNGHFAPEFSSIPPLPKGVRVESLGAALKTDPDLVARFLTRQATYHDNAFTALSTAFLLDGAFIHLEDHAALELPVDLLYIASGRTSPFVSAPRTLVVAGRDTRLAVVERYAGLAQNMYWTNAVTEVFAAEGAVIEHDSLQTEGGHAYHVGNTHFLLAGKSTVTSNAIVLGGAFVRNNVSAVFDGEHAECTLNGLAVATGTQHVDNHTAIDHAKPNCASHELYKAILDGASKGVFNGKIFVRKDAQKTDAKQTNKTLLLSDEATIDTKPQLEIFADDVKCTHGATVGQLDGEQVFYLRSRGVGEADARDLLTFAFASDVVSRIHAGELRAQLDTMLHARLLQGRVAAEDLCTP